MCELCEGRGEIIYIDEHKRNCIKPCTACNVWRDKRTSRLFGNSNLPPCPKDVDLQPKALDYVGGFVNASKDRNWFVLAGRPGTGKTTQAVLIGYEIISRYLKRVAFYDCFDLARKAQALRKRESEYNALRERFLDVDLVVLDDFLKLCPRKDSFGYNEFKDAVLDLLWARYDAKKALVFTTQLTSKAITEFDAAFANRMFERAKNNMVYFDNQAPSWRTK